MTLDRATFFAFARRAPFGNRLTQEQVDGCEAILNAWTGDDDRQLAYVLATAFHETAGTMAPVREGSTPSRRLTDTQARRVVAKYRYGKPDAETGHVYYGRGLVQLTWKRNYAKMGRKLGADLVWMPDGVLDLSVSARILITGMVDGDFTGRKLSDYFNTTADDPEGARRIVNGTDKASLIAGYQRNFLDSLKAARKAGGKAAGVSAGLLPQDAAPAQAAVVPDGADLTKDKTAIGGMLAGLGGLGGIAAFAQPILQGIASPWAFAAFALVAVGVFLVLTGRVQLKGRAGV
ncbi:glycoside hydrolase family 19 protein [Brevundimonas faecalis]|uniref:glycoside hydrolase family 19 protein n=1 Tax=Brevundimonas faecalis TaxID=947378 RepID=UPI00361064B2